MKIQRAQVQAVFQEDYQYRSGAKCQSLISEIARGSFDILG
ncbi:unnamed protein product [Acidithrix sp. C25]|nr:unnamed protein product [Acidithrix sp. C25]